MSGEMRGPGKGDEGVQGKLWGPEGGKEMGRGPEEVGEDQREGGWGAIRGRLGRARGEGDQEGTRGSLGRAGGKKADKEDPEEIGDGKGEGDWGWLAGLGRSRQPRARARCGDSTGGREGQAPETEPFMGAVTEIFEKKQIKKPINPNFLEEHSDDGVHVLLLCYIIIMPSFQ